MSDKQRLIGSSGAIFVPNCDEQTVKDRLASGEWQRVEEPSKPTKAARRPSPKPLPAQE